MKSIRFFLIVINNFGFENGVVSNWKWAIIKDDQVRPLIFTTSLELCTQIN